MGPRAGGARARGAAGAGPGPAGGPPPGSPRDWAGGLPPELLEAVARAVPAGDRLWFRLVCRNWAEAGAGAAPPPDPVWGHWLVPVTRTRPADAAVSVARAEMVLGVLERSPVLMRDWRFSGYGNFHGYSHESFKHDLCRLAAGGGHLEVLQWARAQECDWDEQTCLEAEEGEHFEVLEWARAQGCPE